MKIDVDKVVSVYQTYARSVYHMAMCQFCTCMYAQTK